MSVVTRVAAHRLCRFEKWDFPPPGLGPCEPRVRVEAKFILQTIAKKQLPQKRSVVHQPVHKFTVITCHI